MSRIYSLSLLAKLKFNKSFGFVLAILLLGLFSGWSGKAEAADWIESFDTNSGADNTWTTVTGLPNNDATQSTLDSTGEVAHIISGDREDSSFISQSDVTLTFRVYAANRGSTGFNKFFSIKDSGGTDLAYLSMYYTAGQLRLYNTGGTMVDTGLAMAANTKYYCKIQLIKGTGSNAIIRFWYNTTGVFGTTPSMESTNGTWTANPDRVSLTAPPATGDLYFDHIVQDNTVPTVAAFTVPGTSSSLTVPINTFTASDTVGVTGYIVTESDSTPLASDSGWSAIAPASYTFSSEGSKTLYAWAKDAVGNISTGLSANVEVTLDITPPVVDTFTIPATANSLTVPVTLLTAHDNIGVTGYRLTESATLPEAGDAGWTASAPSTYTFASAGNKILYAWVKDSAENVSNSLSDSVDIAPIYYVRQDATGSNDGSDWSNAYTSLPASLLRGSTYYIADGSYSAVTVNTNVDGTLWIYIKKAVISAHGTDTGWNNSFGDGQAVFPQITVRASDHGFVGGYVDIDGVTGSGTSGYGFVITSTNDQVNLFHVPYYYFGPMGGNVVLKHAEIYNQTYVADRGGDGITVSEGNSDFTFQNLYIHDVSRNNITLGGQSNVTIDNCVVARNHSTAIWHGQGIQVQSGSSGSDNVIIKNNWFEDIQGTAVIALLSGTGSNWDIYNNVFYQSDSGGGIAHGPFSTNDSDTTINTFHFYNNTTVNFKSGLAARIYIPGVVTDGNVKNNLWYCSGTCLPATNTVKTGITLSNNWFSIDIAHSAEENIYGNSSNPFTNYASQGFALAAGADPIGKGATLSSSYNTDKNGTARPQGASWDIGGVCQ